MKKTKASAKSAKQKTNKVLAILTLSTLAITTVIIGQFLILDYNTNKILQDGTVINGYNVSRMSKDEASVILANKFTEKADQFTLTVTSKDKSWTFDKDDFRVNSDIHTILDASQRREELMDTKQDQVTLISQFDKSGCSVNIAFNYIFVGLDERIEKIIKEVEVEPIDSVVIFSPDKKKPFTITESCSGQRVNKMALYQAINEQFLNSNDIKVELDFVEEIPAITKEYNQNNTQKIASFTTNVADSTGGRKRNVKRALDKFNGFVLKPNEQVSFNEIIGDHTIENGYEIATIIYNGEYTDGIGGGICQASSTLYNALLLSGVEIVEVHKHSLPVKYVPLALDAMVAEHTADLKFVNHGEYPIYISSYADSTSVSVDIYSHTLEYEYKAISKTIDTLKSSGDKILQDNDGKYSNKVLFKGEYFRISYPKDGYEAKSYLQKFKDGVLVSETEIRHEIYQPQRGVVVEGAEDVPAGITPIDTGVKIIREE